MIYAQIAGTGSALPSQVMTNAQLPASLETSDAWIQERTGITQRHIAAPNQLASDLALQASRQALAAANLSADTIDLIIVATSTPDYVFPSTACLLQAKLEAFNAAAFDVQAVCTGFIYALATAEKFIRSGSHRHVLVVGAEVFSRILDWNDRNTCVLFGDGAGAVVLRASDRPGIHATVLHADGRHADILSVPVNVNRGQIEGSAFLQMAGNQVFKFAVKVLDEVAREVLAHSHATLEQVDWLIPHQANVRILEATAKRLGIDPARVVMTLDKHANTSAASIPLALDDYIRSGKITRGQRLLLQGVGGGFTWGAVYVTY
jgi:3-oxoacyl-[acyl-carrier-protein] synthase-3